MIRLDRAVGIDLGTTNSEIAVLVPSEREILVYEDRFGRRTVPSAVAWDPKKNDYVVGRPARALRGREPPPVESIKRRMGQAAPVQVGPHVLSPAEISAKILGELRSSMATFLGDRASSGVEMPVLRAVVTVPAYFDAPQIEATRRAVELAGIELAGVLQEPTAAAIYHAFKRKIASGNVLVFDLGGGTFDVSILRSVGGEYQVLAIDGDNYLGGDDLDRRFAEKIRKDLVARGFALDLDVRSSPEDRARFERLVHLAQEIKESLSTREVVDVSRQSLLVDDHGEEVSYEAAIGRAEYEEVVRDLVERTITCALRALEQSTRTANVGLADIDHVVLVGGSTRVPLVARRVTEALCAGSKAETPLADEVDTIVALGAAIHAAQIGGLAIEDDVGGSRVCFTTPLVASGPKVRLGVRVERAPAGARRLAVTGSGGVLCRAELDLEHEGKTTRLELDRAAGAPGDQELSLELQDGEGRALSAVPFVLYDGDVRPRPSALSRASVIAKDISLEIVRGGRRERTPLLTRGTGLPAETKRTFYTADETGTVVLRLLQGRMPIKTLALTVGGEVPIGTPVEITLGCDETMRVEARATVASQELWATVETADEISFDRDGAIEHLLEEADEAKRSLWGTSADAFRREADQLTAAIREVLSTDPAKVVALAGQLRRLLDDYAGDPSDALSPPLHLFEAELDALRRVVFRTPGAIAGLSQDTWIERIREIEERAMTARAEADASRWRRTFNEVQALYETATQEEFARRNLADPAYLAMRIATVQRWQRRIERALADFVLSSSEDVRALQARERDRHLSHLKAHVEPRLPKVEELEAADPREVRTALEECEAELERVDTALERLPALGLVTERGARPK